MEHQTARDTTEGKPRPLGARGAHMGGRVGGRFVTALGAAAPALHKCRGQLFEAAGYFLPPIKEAPLEGFTSHRPRCGDKRFIKFSSAELPLAGPD
jgi:hypothetical protein